MNRHTRSPGCTPSRTRKAATVFDSALRSSKVKRLLATLVVLPQQRQFAPWPRSQIRSLQW